MQQLVIALQRLVIARVCLILQDRREALVGALVCEFEFFFVLFYSSMLMKPFFAYSRAAAEYFIMR